jgi:hypothetical protein
MQYTQTAQQKSATIQNITKQHMYKQTRFAAGKHPIASVTEKINIGECIKCPDGMYCPGGTDIGEPTEKLDCGTDYAGSLYHKLASYAYDTCVRPSKNDNKTSLPHTVLQDINVVMDQIRAGMSDELSKECERLGGTWVSTAYDTDSTVPTLSTYDKETSASKQWGYCKQ